MSVDMIEEVVAPVKKNNAKTKPSVDLGEVNLVEIGSPGVASLSSRDPLDVRIFKMYTRVLTPEYKTSQAACFDIHAFLGNDIQTIKGFNAKNFELNINVRDNLDGDGADRYILLQPGDRALIPTGIIFDLVPGSKMHIYPRSGSALKKGLNLANGVAVIDSDYTDQTFVLITNNTGVRMRVDHNERIAQAEVVPSHRAMISVSSKKPDQKGDRKGGFNSTGVK